MLTSAPELQFFPVLFHLRCVHIDVVCIARDLLQGSPWALERAERPVNNPTRSWTHGCLHRYSSSSPFPISWHQTEVKCNETQERWQLLWEPGRHKFSFESRREKLVTGNREERMRTLKSMLRAQLVGLPRQENWWWRPATHTGKFPQCPGQKPGGRGCSSFSGWKKKQQRKQVQLLRRAPAVPFCLWEPLQLVQCKTTAARAQGSRKFVERRELLPAPRFTLQCSWLQLWATKSALAWDC